MPAVTAIESKFNPGTPDDRDGADAASEHLARRLHRRLEFERRITEASAQLMRSAADDLDAAVVGVLGSIGSFFHVDRAYVFRIDAAHGTQSNSHEWVGEGISAEAQNLQDIPLDVFPWLMRELHADRPVSLDDVAALPPEAGNERAEFDREGIRSIAIVPMWDGERLAGFVGFDAVHRHVHWGEDYVLGLRLLAQILGSALQSREMARRLHAMAYQDTLTGLANRQHLQHALQSMQSRAVPGRVLVALVDLDEFKQVNDEHGHAAGDAVLCEVARRLTAAVPTDALVARLGGDEFVIVLEGEQRLAPAALGHALLQAFAAPFAFEGVPLAVGLSIGMAQAAGRWDARGLLRRADEAMYLAKQSGKNRWHCDSAT